MSKINLLIEQIHNVNNLVLEFDNTVDSKATGLIAFHSALVISHFTIYWNELIDTKKTEAMIGLFLFMISAFLYFILSFPKNYYPLFNTENVKKYLQLEEKKASKMILSTAINYTNKNKATLSKKVSLYKWMNFISVLSIIFLVLSVLPQLIFTL